MFITRKIIFRDLPGFLKVVKRKMVWGGLPHKKWFLVTYHMGKGFYVFAIWKMVLGSGHTINGFERMIVTLKIFFSGLPHSKYFFRESEL